MNIFFTSDCPVKCAVYLDDKRVIKMATETAQMLSTALTLTDPTYYKVPFMTKIFWKEDSNGAPYIARKRLIYKHYIGDDVEIYAPSHENHPSNVWARKSRQNFEWLVMHGLALAAEYKYRYGKYIKSGYLTWELANYSHLFPDIGLTSFANCAANDEKGINYKHLDDVHEAYRLYLSDRWTTDKNPPRWYKKHRNIQVLERDINA